MLRAWRKQRNLLAEKTWGQDRIHAITKKTQAVIADAGGDPCAWAVIEFHAGFYDRRDIEGADAVLLVRRFWIRYRCL